MWCVVRPRLVIKGAWGQHCCWSTYLIQLQMCITYYQHLGDFDDESSHSLNNRRTNQIEVRSKGSIAFYHWLSPEHSWGIFVSTQARAGAIVLYCNSLEGGAVAQLTQLTPAGWACRGGQGVSELVEGGRGSQRGPCCYSAPHRVVLVAHDEQNTSMTFALINHHCSCCSFPVNLHPKFQIRKTSTYQVLSSIYHLVFQNN